MFWGSILRRNLGNSSLKRRRRSGSTMTEYDQLPTDLRIWLAGAVLPWSPRSLKRLWPEVLKQVGDDPEAAQQRLSEIEAGQIARDARMVWGRAHPAAEAPGVRS